MIRTGSAAIGRRRRAGAACRGFPWRAVQHRGRRAGIAGASSRVGAALFSKAALRPTPSGQGSEGRGRRGTRRPDARQRAGCAERTVAALAPELARGQFGALDEGPSFAQAICGWTRPPRPQPLMHACIVVSLMAGVRPEEARAIGWEEAGAETSPPFPRCPASSRQREPPNRYLRHQRAAWLARSPPDRGSLRIAGLLSRRDTPPGVTPARLAEHAFAGRAGQATWGYRPATPAESPARTRLLVSSAMISASPAAMPSMASLAMAAGSDLGTSRWRVMSVSM